MSQRSIEERFDAQQVIAMAQRLAVREIEALGEATELREAGLRRARAGDLADGGRLIGSARANIARVALSDEAATIFETYQRPAESYVDFREGRFAIASTAMHAAIADANRLRALYGYIVELRRIHLAANLVRIAATGVEHDEAVLAGSLLVRYIRGDRRAWPWPELALEDVDPLSVEARLFVLAQVLRPLADAIAARNAGGACLRPDDDALLGLAAERGEGAIGEAVAQWVAATRARVGAAIPAPASARAPAGNRRAGRG